MGARNPSGAAVRGTKDEAAPGPGLRKPQVWPRDLEVLEEARVQAGVPTGGTLWN